MKIHSLFYILMGGLVAGYSWFINKSSDSKKLIVFFYLGLAFAVFGLLKYIILRKSPEEKVRKTVKPVQTQFYNRCRRCGLEVNMFDNFCSRCGTYLKGRG